MHVHLAYQHYSSDEGAWDTVIGAFSDPEVAQRFVTTKELEEKRRVAVLELNDTERRRLETAFERSNPRPRVPEASAHSEHREKMLAAFRRWGTARLAHIQDGLTAFDGTPTDDEILAAETENSYYVEAIELDVLAQQTTENVTSALPTDSPSPGF